MQVRLGGVTGISNQPEHLSALYMISEFYLQASGLQMCVKGVTALANIQDYMIAGDGFQSDGHSSGVFSRNVFRNSVFNLSNGSIRYGHGITAVGAIIFVVQRIAGVGGLAIRVEPYPVNGEALTNLCAATNRDQCPAMPRTVGRPIARTPVVATQRRGNYGQIPAYGNTRALNCDRVRILADSYRDLVLDSCGDLGWIIQRYPHINHGRLASAHVQLVHSFGLAVSRSVQIPGQI